MKLRDRLLTGFLNGFLISGVLLYSLALPPLATAQVIPDGTTPTTIGACNTLCLITGGTTRGSNLFHSFRELSVEPDQQVRFANPNGISNILSRVTGRNASNIQGTLGVDGGANLFLLNPNGIIFGPNARLDIRGSFVATTANRFVFSNGGEFSAINPQAPPLLAIHTPIGLQFGSAPSDIINQSRADLMRVEGFLDSGGLQVRPGQTLALIGGRILFSKGLVTAPQARVELGSVAGGNVVTLRETVTGFTFSYPDVQRFQDMQFLGEALINTSGDRAGAIQLQGRRLTFSGGSIVNSTTREVAGGALTIHATDSVRFSGANTLLLTDTQGSGSAGDLIISTQRLTVEQGAFIGTFTSGTGRAGDVLITALDAVNLSGTSTNSSPSGVAAQVNSTGRGGNVTLATSRLLIRDGAILDASTFGAGDAGNITVRANESVMLIGDSPASTSGIFAQVARGAIVAIAHPGNAGNLTITTRQLLVADGAQISVAGRQGGNAGNLTIHADAIQLTGFSQNVDLEDDTRSGLFVSSEPRSTGLAGNLNVTAERLVIENEARLSADNFGSGSRAGNVNLDVQQLVLTRGAINASTAAGEGANITLRVQNLLLQNQSRISAQATNNANGGNITVNAGNGFVIAAGDSDIIANAFAGQGGAIQISAQGIVELEERRTIEGNGTNDIDASSEFGAPGTVTLTSSDINPSQGLVELPGAPITTQLSQGCGGSASSTSRFISSGRSGLPINPYEPLSNSDVLADVQPPEALAVSSHHSIRGSTRGFSGYSANAEPMAEPIVEAQRWRIDEQGEILLVADAAAIAQGSCQMH